MVQGVAVGGGSGSAAKQRRARTIRERAREKSGLGVVDVTHRDARLAGGGRRDTQDWREERTQ